jgi:hypothetical protein
VRNKSPDRGERLTARRNRSIVNVPRRRQLSSTILLRQSQCQVSSSGVSDENVATLDYPVVFCCIAFVKGVVGEDTRVVFE